MEYKSLGNHYQAADLKNFTTQVLLLALIHKAVLHFLLMNIVWKYHLIAAYSSPPVEFFKDRVFI